MYDHEKSDPAIVAVKPTNKAGQPAAELVEPRVGAEGNVSQQSTGRAQYRGTVSQALKRIRQAARQRKKEKFTALFHHVSIDHLTSIEERIGHYRLGGFTYPNRMVGNARSRSPPLRTRSSRGLRLRC